MKKLSNLLETYIREEPTREEPPKSKLVQQIEEFAQKEKRAEIIKTWTKIKDHPEATDLKSEVGSAFDKEELDEELNAAFEAIGEGGMIYATWEHSFWIRHKKQLIRVM